eukprot:1195791-Prorocentrum_minimum.AAC.5
MNAWAWRSPSWRSEIISGECAGVVVTVPAATALNRMTRQALLASQRGRTMLYDAYNGHVNEHLRSMFTSYEGHVLGALDGVIVPQGDGVAGGVGRENLVRHLVRPEHRQPPAGGAHVHRPARTQLVQPQGASEFLHHPYRL